MLCGAHPKDACTPPPSSLAVIADSDQFDLSTQTAGYPSNRAEARLQKKDSVIAEALAELIGQKREWGDLYGRRVEPDLRSCSAGR